MYPYKAKTTSIILNMQITYADFEVPESIAGFPRPFYSVRLDWHDHGAPIPSWLLVPQLAFPVRVCGTASLPSDNRGLPPPPPPASPATHVGDIVPANQCILACGKWISVCSECVFRRDNISMCACLHTSTCSRAHVCTCMCVDTCLPRHACVRVSESQCVSMCMHVYTSSWYVHVCMITRLCLRVSIVCLCASHLIL